MIEKMASVVAVDDLAEAVARWTLLTGVAPSFVDAGRWAQFDTPAGRIALAAAVEAPHGSGMMFKVSDLAGTRASLVTAGLAVGEIETGGHERRFALVTDDVAVTFYTPLQGQVTLP